MRPLRAWTTLLFSSSLALAACGNSDAEDPSAALAGASSVGAPGTAACVGAPTKLLATEPSDVDSALKVDDAFLYYVSPRTSTKEQSDLVRLPKAGGQAQRLATFNGAVAQPLFAMDATNVYFIDALVAGGMQHQTIYRAPKDGHGTRTKVADVGYVKGIQLDGTTLYVASEGRDSSNLPTTILKIDLESLAVTTLWSTPFVAHVSNVVVDDQFVYWADDVELMALVRAPKAGGPPQVVVKEKRATDGVSGMHPLFVGPTTLYYGASGGDWDLEGAIFSVPKDGSGGFTLVSKIPTLDPVSTVDDGDRIYAAAGELLLGSKSGGTPTKIPVCPDPSAATIAVDSTTIYFANGEKIFSTAR